MVRAKSRVGPSATTAVSPLHRHGAEAGATNDFGESAVTLAESRGHRCVLGLLRGEPAGSSSGGSLGGTEHK